MYCQRPGCSYVHPQMMQYPGSYPGYGGMYGGQPPSNQYPAHNYCIFFSFLDFKI